MGTPARSLRRLARAGAGLAAAAGAYGSLYLMGAFGPVSCWRSYSQGGTATRNGSASTTTPTVTTGCESGIDFLLGTGGPPGGGNAGTLFAWSTVLLGLVAVGVAAAWTDHRRTTWATVVLGAAITVVGVFSIGWFFLLPTLFLLVAATANSVRARRYD
jgi:hypothetical protein